MSGNTPKLHEVLAVEADLKAVAEKITDETLVTFTKKAHHFIGHRKWLVMFDDERQQEAEGAGELKEVVETVPSKLRYSIKSLAKYWDAVLQKEATNQLAVADLKVGDVVLEKLPATWLLGTETRLKKLRAMIEAAPTHEPGIAWEADPELPKGIFRAREVVKTRREEKSLGYQTVAEATEHHPAQVMTWNQNNVVGTYHLQKYTSTISPAQKSEMLERCDEVMRAVKKARQRANSQEVIKRNESEKIFDYILGE